MMKIKSMISAVLSLSLLVGLPGLGYRAQAVAPNDTPVSRRAFLPIVSEFNPFLHAYGIESDRSLLGGSTMLSRTLELNASIVRLNSRVRWVDLQPDDGGPINYTPLAHFESEVLAVGAQGLRPVVVINQYPRWATVKPTSCGAIREDKLPAFALFMGELVSRYSKPPFNIRDWEMGNEPDVDPSLVGVDHVFGCWGDMNDEFYNGRSYGAMLKAVAPAIRVADPKAKIWFGGLLLSDDDSKTGNPSPKQPARFFEGALMTGAGGSFDIVGVHSYGAHSVFEPAGIDPDRVHGQRSGFGKSGIVGKLTFLQSVMARYSVSKPIYLNEAGLICWRCDEPQIGMPPDFYQVQADHLVRLFSRALAHGAVGVQWYTLEGPGWSNTGLLNGDDSPRPAFHAYKNMVQHTYPFVYAVPVSYTGTVEAYRFGRKNGFTDIVWQTEKVTRTVSVPQSSFVNAVDSTGTAVVTTVVGSQVEFVAGPRPILIVRQ